MNCLSNGGKGNMKLETVDDVLGALRKHKGEFELIPFYTHGFSGIRHKTLITNEEGVRYPCCPLAVLAIDAGAEIVNNWPPDMILHIGLDKSLANRIVRAAD